MLGMRERKPAATRFVCRSITSFIDWMNSPITMEVGLFCPRATALAQSEACSSSDRRIASLTFPEQTPSNRTIDILAQQFASIHAISFREQCGAQIRRPDCVNLIQEYLSPGLEAARRQPKSEGQQ